MIKTVYDLNQEQLRELKEAYCSELVNEGIFGEIMGRDYDEPSWDDYVNIDEIIPDEFIQEKNEGYIFTDDDFFCTADI